MLEAVQQCAVVADLEMSPRDCVWVEDTTVVLIPVRSPTRSQVNVSSRSSKRSESPGWPSVRLMPVLLAGCS